ncbi:MAG: alpha/beta hydrolase family protein [Nannocystales bacterium]
MATGSGDPMPHPQPGSGAPPEPSYDLNAALPPACEGDPAVVTFETADGVALEADFVPSGQASGKAVVLLHMIPPSNDRRNYPAGFINALASAGYSVLNVDRRGAGGSAGDATAAYEGPAGKEDALAAVAWLARSACAIHADEVVLVGASNGTTTALDYTVASQTPPRALVFLSPGAYTENQNAVAEHAELLSGLSVFMGYPDNERRWPESVRAVSGETWEFHQYDGGSHGSRLFMSNKEVTNDILGFLAGL